MSGVPVLFNRLGDRVPRAGRCLPSAALPERRRRRDRRGRRHRPVDRLAARAPRASRSRSSRPGRRAAARARPRPACWPRRPNSSPAARRCWGLRSRARPYGRASATPSRPMPDSSSTIGRRARWWSRSGRDETERLRVPPRAAAPGRPRHALAAGSEVRALEPGLRPAVTGGIFCPGDHQVDPLSTLAALVAPSCGAAAISSKQRPVEALATGGRPGQRRRSRRPALPRRDTSSWPPGRGRGGAAWLPAGLQLPVRPLKGQSLALRPRGGAAAASTMWSGAPTSTSRRRRDGRLILGATVEEAGFDPAITAGGVFALLDGVRRVLPGIEEMAVESIWTGFRPTSDDDAPILGETPLPGLVVAAGHHRNGYLLAPVTAEAIDDLIVDGPDATAPPRNFGIGAVRSHSPQPGEPRDAHRRSTARTGTDAAPNPRGAVGGRDRGLWRRPRGAASPSRSTARSCGRPTGTGRCSREGDRVEIIRAFAGG